MQRVDVGALTGAEAEVVQADPLLLEGGVGVLGRRRADPDRGAAADAVEIGLGVDDRLHAQKRQQLAVELAGTLEIRRRSGKYAQCH